VSFNLSVTIVCKAVKAKVDLFAKERNLEDIYYSMGWPHFKIEWKNSYGVDCLIQLYMDLIGQPRAIFD